MTHWMELLRSVALSWTAPSNDGSSPITGGGSPCNKLFVSEVIQQPHVDIRTCFLKCSYVGVLRCISCMSWVAAELLPEIVTGYVLSYDSGDYTDFLNNRRSTIEKVLQSARQVKVNEYLYSLEIQQPEHDAFQTKSP